MKRTLILLIIITISLSIFAQTERNYAQELINLLHQERYFEAKDFKHQYDDKLPHDNKALDLIYNIHMSIAFNKPDSTIVFIEELLSNNDYDAILGPFISAYYRQLTKAYESQQLFASAISSVDRSLEWFIKTPFLLDQNFVENEINNLNKKKQSLENKAKNEPLRKIVKNSDNQNIKLLEGEDLRFEGLYNGQKIETIFDTGTSYYFILEKEIADLIGIKIIEYKDSISAVNNQQINTVKGSIDSIDFNGLKLYNIPVLIIKDKLIWDLSNKTDSASKSDIIKKKQIIMGVPTMKMIGKIEIDWENRFIRFPQTEKSSRLNNNSNFFLIDNVTYLNLTINKCKFTGFLDTGSEHFLDITFRYFVQNSNFLELENTSQKKTMNRHSLIKAYHNIPYEILKEPQVYLNNDIVTSGEYKSYVIDPVWLSGTNTLDGQIGVYFIKGLGKKVIFDFDNMTIK